MKKVLLISIICTLGASFVSAQEKINLLDSTVTYINFIDDSLKTDKVIFDYDRSGRIISWASINWNSNVQHWVNVRMQTRKYPGGNKSILTEYEWNEDSLDWIPEYKYEDDYDQNGNQILEAHYIYLPSKKQFMPARKFESFYSLDLLKVIIDYYPDSTLNGWTPSGKKEYSYNSSGEKELEIYHDWYSSLEEWTYKLKVQYSYDFMNRLTNVISHKWSPELNQWLNGSKSQSIYDDNGNRVQEISSIWNQVENEWTYYMMEVDTFDQYGNNLFYTRLFWNQEEGSWTSDIQIENSYDSIGNLIRMFHRKWDNTKDDWQLVFKNHYAYDINRNTILDIRYKWDDESDDWLPWQKEIREYLPIGESFLLEVFRWSTTYNAWVGRRKFETLYDNSMMRFCEIQYYWFENQWYKDRSKFFYYNTMSLGTSIVQNDEITIFPNPTTDIINITGLTQPAEVTIYSIQGQLLITENRVEKTIDISDLSTGVYILGLKSGNVVIKKTIVKN